MGCRSGRTDRAGWPGGPLLCRQTQSALTTLDLIAEELKPVCDMHDAGLFRMQANVELLVQKCPRKRQCRLGLPTRATDDDEVICESRQPIPGFGHRVV